MLIRVIGLDNTGLNWQILLATKSYANHFYKQINMNSNYYKWHGIDKKWLSNAS